MTPKPITEFVPISMRMVADLNRLAGDATQVFFILLGYTCRWTGVVVQSVDFTTQDLMRLCYRDRQGVETGLRALVAAGFLQREILEAGVNRLKPIFREEWGE